MTIEMSAAEVAELRKALAPNELAMLDLASAVIEQLRGRPTVKQVTLTGPGWVPSTTFER